MPNTTDPTAPDNTAELRYQHAADVRADLKGLKRDTDSSSSQHMDDVKIALQEPKEESDSGILGAAVVSRPNPRRRLHWVLSVAAAVVVAIVGVWLVRSKKEVPETQLIAVPLTSYLGNESWPSFSPDGTQVAFAWDGEKQNNWISTSSKSAWSRLIG